MTAEARITAVLGPTNTGKTHYAIERMLGYRTGVIGLPLRLKFSHGNVLDTRDAIAIAAFGWIVISAVSALPFVIHTMRRGGAGQRMLIGVLIGAYLQRYAASSLVGVTGSVFLVLLWIFFVGQIVLAGAEFTRVLVLRGVGASAASVGGDGEAGAGPGHDATVDVDR